MSFVVTQNSYCYDSVMRFVVLNNGVRGVLRGMRNYNFLSPILLVVVALIVRGLVTNLGVLFGLSQEVASNIAMIAMIIAALIMFNRMTKARRRK
ncbi:hypothetical protein PAEAM_04440 [Paenibacillus sp. GM1FR]|nr:hypothetical protein PAEAM_04440 [Paenibacillus sp. GM1FR]